MIKKLLTNSISSLVLEIATVINGLLLPRIILVAYGSSTNGLVTSITHFLSLITFLELGVGAVIQSALYVPLANNDSKKLSAIISSGKAYFDRIVKLLLLYILLLSLFYPFLIKNEYDWLFSFTLVLSMSFCSLAQFYFGVLDRLLLNADNKAYIHQFLQTIILLLNLFFSSVLIKNNVSIQVVKLFTSFIFCIKPILIHIYVKDRYEISNNVILDEDPIKQKKNGIAQHVCSVLLDGSDIVVITFFCELVEVSVYSVYSSVISGAKTVVMSITNSFQPVLGKYWAKKEYRDLEYYYTLLDFITHIIVCFIFGCTVVLILPFIRLYTSGVNDTNYQRQLFSILIVVANALYCLKIPDHTLIKACNKYKETQKYYYISSIIKIIITVLGVLIFGITGAAIGSIVANLYQCITLSIFTRKSITTKHFHKLRIKQYMIDSIYYLLLIVFSKILIANSVTTFYEWTILGIKTSIISVALLFAINMIFNFRNLKSLLKIF